MMLAGAVFVFVPGFVFAVGGGGTSAEGAGTALAAEDGGIGAPGGSMVGTGWGPGVTIE